MVHRDLKPANLMLTPARGRDQPDTVLQQTVKILDIGLGRALFDEGTPGAADLGDLTNEGALLGTPNYMAPEQARNAHAADIRSDIYSLGCVFYEMLTGQAPFPDNSFVRQMVRHATEPVRPLRELIPDLPEEVQPVMDMLLAKDPAQRYAIPSQAARAIKALAPQLPDVAPLPEPGPQLRSYLTWLENRRPEDGETPLPAPPTVRVPAAVAPAPTPQPVAQPVPVAIQPAPGAAPIARPAAPVAAPVPVRPLAPVSVVHPATPLWRMLRPSRREVFFAFAGAAALLIFEAIVWLVLFLTR
jgi:serine/threonine protein kinase